MERPRPSGLADIGSAEDAEGLPQLIEGMTSGGAKSKTKGALEGAKEAVFGDGARGEKTESGTPSGSRSRKQS